MKTRFDFFLRILKNFDTPESFDALISPEKLALLSLLKEVKPSPKRTSNYKTSNI